MPHDDVIIFGDLIGKLDMLRIECAKCSRSDKYRLAALIAQYAATKSCSPGRTS